MHLLNSTEHHLDGRCRPVLSALTSLLPGHLGVPAHNTYSTWPHVALLILGQERGISAMTGG
jgi:hypothetical protein